MIYTHLTANELVMIEASYQENIKVSDIITLLRRLKQIIIWKRGALPMITMNGIKSIRNAIVGI